MTYNDRKGEGMNNLNSGCSRQTAKQALEEIIKLNESKTERLKKLLAFVEENNPDPEVEETLWSLFTNIRGGYYL